MESLFRQKESLMESLFGRMEARMNTPEHPLRVWRGRNFQEKGAKFPLREHREPDSQTSVELHAAGLLGAPARDPPFFQRDWFAIGGAPFE